MTRDNYSSATAARGRNDVIEEEEDPEVEFYGVHIRLLNSYGVWAVCEQRVDRCYDDDVEKKDGRWLATEVQDTGAVEGRRRPYGRSAEAAQPPLNRGESLRSTASKGSFQSFRTFASEFFGGERRRRRKLPTTTDTTTTMMKPHEYQEDTVGTSRQSDSNGRKATVKRKFPSLRRWSKRREQQEQRPTPTTNAVRPPLPATMEEDNDEDDDDSSRDSREERSASSTIPETRDLEDSAVVMEEEEEDDDTVVIRATVERMLRSEQQRQIAFHRTGNSDLSGTNTEPDLEFLKDLHRAMESPYQTRSGQRKNACFSIFGLRIG